MNIKNKRDKYLRKYYYNDLYGNKLRARHYKFMVKMYGGRV